MSKRTGKVENEICDQHDNEKRKNEIINDLWKINEDLLQLEMKLRYAYKSDKNPQTLDVKKRIYAIQRDLSEIGKKMENR